MYNWPNSNTSRIMNNLQRTDANGNGCLIIFSSDISIYYIFICVMCMCLCVCVCVCTMIYLFIYLDCLLFIYIFDQALEKGN